VKNYLLLTFLKSSSKDSSFPSHYEKSLFNANGFKQISFPNARMEKVTETHITNFVSTLAPCEKLFTADLLEVFK